MAEQNKQIPLAVKLKLFAYVPVIISSAIHYVIVVTFSTGPRRSLKRTIVASLSRSSALTIGPLLSEYTDAQPTTGEGIRTFCKAKEIALQSVTITKPESGHDMSASPTQPATLHVLKTNTAGNRTLLYLHGGGYTSPAYAASHVAFALKLAAAAEASSLAFLEYGLAPGLRYPGQLVQGTEALRYLLQTSTMDDVGGAASNIILAGDSAGANLLGGVLAHLYCPSPYADPIDLRGRLGAAVLISPWLGNRFEGGSYTSNAGFDTIDVKGMIRAREKWCPNTDDIWADMLNEKAPRGTPQDDEFWMKVFSGSERVVDRAVVTVGEDEIFLDDIVRFGAMSGATEAANESSTATLIKSPGETHCGAMLDAVAGIQEDHSMLSELLAWLGKV